VRSAGDYVNGTEATDNKTKFAVSTDEGANGYFEIVQRQDEWRVDLQITVLAPDGS